jgi:hypothetical protein
MLATPGPNGDAVLESAIVAAASAGLVAPRHHVVVLQQIHEDFCVKVGVVVMGAASGFWGTSKSNEEGKCVQVPLQVSLSRVHDSGRCHDKPKAVKEP